MSAMIQEENLEKYQFFPSPRVLTRLDWLILRNSLWLPIDHLTGGVHTGHQLPRFLPTCSPSRS